MLLIKGERNDFTGRTKWGKEPIEVDIEPITIEVRKFAKKIIYYTNEYRYGKNSKMNPNPAGDTIQTLYKEELQ